ncbi:MAG: pitrilysin family protein [Verrucomicrobiota bacterium]|nr:pitrilysin family protein [Verrucomicrobiota bacterium]
MKGPPLDQISKISTYANGARLVTTTLPGKESVAVGIFLGVGGRCEKESLSGVSHFIEHLLFKGTKTRTTLQISQAVEGVGGYINAYTSEESTCYYARVSLKHFDEVVDVLSDMILNSTFNPDEVEKERGVVLEEIAMYLDQPSQYVQEVLNSVVWPNAPLGRPLTGTTETMSAMKRADVVRFKKQSYVAPNIVVSVAGPLPHEDVKKHLDRFMKRLPGGEKPAFEPARPLPKKVSWQIVEKKVEQMHVAIGFPGVSRNHSSRFALRVLSVVLGENMSSRLFQVIREKHGLAYSIGSGTSSLADTGLFSIFAGVPTDKVEKALKLIFVECRKMSETALSPKELQRAKDYLLGQMHLSLENTSEQMMWVGEQVLAYGRIYNPSDITTRINAITADEVVRAGVAALNPKQLRMAIIGPEFDKKCIEKSLVGFCK